MPSLLSQPPEDSVSLRAADMPGADELMLRVYAALAQKERELIGERTWTALAAAKARGQVLWAWWTGGTGLLPPWRPWHAAWRLAGTGLVTSLKYRHCRLPTLSAWRSSPVP